MRAKMRMSVRGRSIRSQTCRIIAASLSFAGSATALSAPARAEVEEVAGARADNLDDSRLLQVSADSSHWLPGVVAASVGSYSAAGSGWGGYDGATHNPLIGAQVEAVVARRLAIGAGATYAAATGTSPAAARPSVSVRLQLLNQQRHGFNAGLSLGYGRDRFASEEGILQGTIAAGWQTERSSLLANVGYGQDGEGDDQEGSVRVTGLHRLGRNFHVGFDGRLRKLLHTTDQKTLTFHGAPSLELSAGPIATFTTGSWAVLVETGASAVRRESLQPGAIVIGGVGASF